MPIPTLINYLADSDRAARLSAATGAHPQWLWQISRAWRGKRCGSILARAIESATCGAVTRHDLRPDLFTAATAANEPTESAKAA